MYHPYEADKTPDGVECSCQMSYASEKFKHISEAVCHVRQEENNNGHPRNHGPLTSGPQ